MADNKPETGKTGKRRQRQAAAAAEIYAALPTPEDIVFLARELILCTLPHSDPGDVPAWSRVNGNLSLTLRPGWNEREKRVYGYPYGIIPRLILVWMVTEILRTKSRRLQLGHSLSDFLLKLGLDPGRGGERSDARRVREQMERLFHAIVSFDYSVSRDGHHAHAWTSMQVVSDGVLWWSEQDPERDSPWGSWIEVGEKLHQAVLSAPSPMDIRVLRHIKDSSLGIDLYAILNREAFIAMKSGKPRFLAWEWLMVQTGNEYADIRDFRKKALIQIEAILEVHPGLIITVQKGRRGQRAGLWISNLSTPSILPDWVEEALPASPIASAAVPPPRQILKPATVETFGKRYPGLDPHACQATFDAWQEGLAPENKARRYDSAFLGFAAKWSKGKR